MMMKKSVKNWNRERGQVGRALKLLLRLGGLLLIACMVFGGTAQAQTTHRFYVDATSPAATANQDGSSWLLAWKDLQTALDAADGAAVQDIKEVWVAEGVYFPWLEMVPGDPASISFELPVNTRIFGGFRGASVPPGPQYPGEDFKNDRVANYTTTVLSGSIQVSGQTQRVRHVVYCRTSSGSSTFRAEVNGFRIEKGRAAGSSFSDNRGGGIYAFDTNLLVKNCEFVGNLAAEQGGAIYWDNGVTAGGQDHVVGFGASRSRFSGNVAVHSGGAIYARVPTLIGGYGDDLIAAGVLAKSHIHNCEFAFNKAGLTNDPQTIPLQGGGAVTLFNPSGFSTVGNIFQNNQSRGRGSAMYIDFEYNLGLTSNIRPQPYTFRNNTFYGNINLQMKPTVGDFTPAVVYSEPQPSTASPGVTAPTHTVTHDLVWGNTGATSSGVQSVTRYYPQSHFIVHSSDIEYAFSTEWPNPTPGNSANQNINEKPLFVDPLLGNFKLQATSPCRNTGTSPGGFSPDWADLDSDGLIVLGSVEVPFAPRNDFQSAFFAPPTIGTLRVQGASVDIGAHERD